MALIRALLLLSLAFVGGCGDLCLDGIQSQLLVCNASGSATFTSEASGLSQPARVDTLGSCLPAEESCASFDFQVTAAGAGDMSMSVGGDGSATVSMYKNLRGHVTLPSPMVFIDAERYVPATASLEQLGLVDGELEVEAPDDSHFTVAFTIHLRNDANEKFTIAGGQAHIDCEPELECSVPST